VKKPEDAIELFKSLEATHPECLFVQFANTTSLSRFALVQTDGLPLTAARYRSPVGAGHDYALGEVGASDTADDFYQVAYIQEAGATERVLLATNWVNRVSRGTRGAMDAILMPGVLAEVIEHAVTGALLLLPDDAIRYLTTLEHERIETTRKIGKSLLAAGHGAGVIRFDS
jgi:hypothetical protein